MIDTKELRRLAQAATPGPWWVNQDSLNHGFECGVLEINAKDWHALAGAWGVTGAKPSEEGAANAAFIAAANPAAINELLYRLEAAEKERDDLRAKIEAMEKQEPAAWLHETRPDSDVVTSAVKHVWGKAVVGALAAYSIPLYLAPGAQEQPSPGIPEITDDLIEAIESRAEQSFRRHHSGVRGQLVTPADDLSWHIIHVTRDVLATAPEAKP